MGPVARKMATLWQADMGLAGNVPRRPGVFEKLRGKKVDNGWGWGILTSMTEGMIAPLIEIGVLTVDLMATSEGEALMGVESFKKAFPGAKTRHVRAYMRVREALCEYTGDDNRPARLKEAVTVHARRCADTFKEAWSKITANRDAGNRGTEVTIRRRKKR